MSRDKRLNRTQEVVGSIPISSTNRVNNLAGARASALLFLRKLSELRPHRARSLAAARADCECLHFVPPNSFGFFLLAAVGWW